MLPEEQSTTMPVDKSAWFTTTHWTMVLSARQSDSPQAAEALEKLCRTYWYPLYAYVRRRGHAPHDAQDLTQEFFARLLENNSLGVVEREKGKFRSPGGERAGASGGLPLHRCRCRRIFSTTLRWSSSAR